jgi:undecaprenyl-diphosphatase
MRAMFHAAGVLDRTCLEKLAVRSAPRWLDRLLRAVTHLGGAVFTLLLPVPFLLVPAGRKVGLELAAANALSHLAVQALKRTVVRPRPRLLGDEPLALIALPDRFSFPSGHSCAAMAMAVPLMLAGGFSGALAFGLALLVGVSRVYLRVHYVTDVLVGQLLGAGAAAVVVTSLKP